MTTFDIVLRTDSIDTVRGLTDYLGLPSMAVYWEDNSGEIQLKSIDSGDLADLKETFEQMASARLIFQEIEFRTKRGQEYVVQTFSVEAF